jgi:gamma-glutamyl-gamma-aminobutyrate hydrolase PuuD
MKIFDVGVKYGFPIHQLFPHATPVYSAKDADLVCFGGGEDISPRLYGHKPIQGQLEFPSERDSLEYNLFASCRKFNKPMLGICRGSQFLCVMSGGALIQDTDGHTCNHDVQTSNGTLRVTSTHHQMMLLPEDCIVLAECERRGTHWEYDSERWKAPLPAYDPEAVFFPATKALAIQFHPEYEPESEAAKWVVNQVNFFLKVKTS